MSISDKIYFVPFNLIEQNKSLTGQKAIKKGILSLYDKNSMRFSKWRVLSKSIYRDGLIVQRSNCPQYWKNVIKIYEL